MGRKDPDTLVKTLDGTITKYRNCLGYCRNMIHPGYITNNIEQQHECLKKNCSSFVLLDKNECWIKKQERKNRKKERKMLIKEHRQISNKILEIAPEASKPFFCTHLYDSTYMLIINNEYYYPKKYFKKRIPNVVVYVRYVPKERCKNIDITYYLHLPKEMKDKYIKYKQDQNKRHI